MHKKLLLLFLLFTTLSNAQSIDVLHYKFSLALKDENDTVNGSAVISFVQKARDAQVSFDLVSPGKNGKGMKVVSVSTTNDSANLLFSQTEEKLSVNLSSIKKGDTTSIIINYKGVPDDGLIISRNKFGDRTFFGDNWPNRARHWLPCIDQPDDKASFEFLVSAPAQYRVISNGVKVTEKDLGNGSWLTHWKEDVPLPTKVMVIGVARFASKIYDDSPTKVPVSVWVYPQDSTKGTYDFAVAPEMVKFFSDYIGPFPYEKLANVQSTTIFGGMENASCIFYDEKLVRGNRFSEDIVAHEIAHQWFGDAASEKSFAHLWLSEGFATYFTNLYWEQKYGKEAMQERLKKDREEVIAFAKSSSHPVVDSTKNLMSLLNTNSYQKGGWILHMLRAEVGDAVFQKIIRAYYNGYKGGNADTRDFEAMAEKVSGKDLRWFFDQWLYRPGVPRLKITKTITKAGVRLTVEQLQKNLYDLKLPVSIETTTTKETTTTFVVKDRVKSVLLSKGKMLKMVVDPDCILLFEETK